MGKKKNDPETPEIQTEKKHRSNEEIFTEKMNSAGNITLKQIRKIESAQINAIKTGNVVKFNKVIDNFIAEFEKLKLPENATIEEKPKESKFDISNF